MSHTRVRPAAEPLEVRDVPATAYTDLPVLPDPNPLVLTHLRAVAAHGEQLGRRTDAFMKVGDSNTASTDYLVPLGAPGYDPVGSGLSAIDPRLVDTLVTYRHPVDPSGANSFTRSGLSEHPGWRIEDTLPTIPQEVSAVNPAVALVLIGTNDVVWYSDVATYEARLRQLLSELEGEGVIPLLSTLPEDHYNNSAYSARVPQYNQAIADVADEFRLPVVNLWRALEPLPNTGLKPDELHLTVSPNGGGAFQPADLQYAQNLRAVLMLQSLRLLEDRVFPAAGAPPGALVSEGQPWTPLASGKQYYVTGADRDLSPVVKVYDAGTGQVVNSFLAYAADFSGGVRVALGDVDGDGIPDVVTAPGPGGGPNIRVYSGRDGGLLANFFAYEPSFRGGANVAVGDLAGDGKVEIVVGTGAGGGPRVRVFRPSDQAILADFFAFEPSFRGGVNVAAGDFGGDIGRAVVAGAGDGGGPVVKVFRYPDLSLAASFFAYDPAVRGGVNVAAGDLNSSGRDEIVTGPGSDTPNVKVFDPKSGSELLSFYTGPAGQGGVRVAVVPAQNGGAPRIVTGNGPGAPAAVRVYAGLDGDGGRTEQPGDSGDLNGISVGG